MKTQYSEMVDAHIYVKGGAVTRRDWHAVISAAWDQHHSAPEDSEGRDMKEQRNVDGDTLADLVRAQSDCNNAAALENSTTSGWTPCVHFLSGNRNVMHYRITAKHADRFDPKCMSFEVWARAAFGRGMDLQQKHVNGKVVIYHDMIHGVNGFSYGSEETWVRTRVVLDLPWTAIPRAEAPATTERHIHAGIGYLQPLWELMHNEHKLILVETELHDIMAACKEVEKRLRDEAPALEEWEECSAREADQFSVRTVFTDGIWSPWQDVPSDMRGKQTGFSDFIRHRRKKYPAEAQGGEYPRCVNQACSCWDSTSEGCRYHYDRDEKCECRTDISEKPDGKRPAGEPRWAKQPRPGFDVQAAIDSLRASAKHDYDAGSEETNTIDRLVVLSRGDTMVEIADALQAGIGGTS